MKIVCAFLLLTSLSFAQEIGNDVVASVLRNPGVWEQNCRRGFDPVNPLELPTRGYKRFWSDYTISAENWQKLRNCRGPVVRDLSRRLLAMKAKAVTQSKFEVCQLSGDWPRARKFWVDIEEYETYLEMIQELDGVEAVPGLLALEKALNERPLWMVKRGKGTHWTHYGLHIQTLSVLGYLVHQRTGELDDLPKYANYDSYTRNRIVAAASRL